ncbi:hypothetical protein IFM89_037281 [Coptis chinensis]|uniref:Uncharacterized protein n=1 Tax=Coptis chinensis TaxID=261450 RepID=A0A835I9X1_9MAGN|nr:hypothetical protein IFM89_037281 [Coptis chinensis]
MIIFFNTRLLIDYFAIYVRISFEMVLGQPHPSASQPSGSDASQPSASQPSGSHASQPSGNMQESENVRKLPILIDIDGVVVDHNATRWNTRAGSLIRARIPVSYTNSRLVHPDFKDKVWNALMREFEVTNVDQALARSHAEKNFCTKFRYGKWALRKDILMMARNAKNGESIKLNDSRHTLGRDMYANMLHKMNKENPDKIHGRVYSWKARHECRNGTILESARARYEFVEAAQKKRKNATSSGEGSATHLDFDNDKLTEVLGADKRNRTHGISSNHSKKQLKRTSIVKVMLAQARSSSNSEFKGEMSEMMSSIARVEGVMMIFKEEVFDLPEVSATKAAAPVRNPIQIRETEVRTKEEMDAYLSRGSLSRATWKY